MAPKKEKGDVETWVDEHPEVKRVYGSLAPNTKRSYYAFFKRYCTWIEEQEARPMEPKELWQESWEKCRDSIMDFRCFLEEEGKASTSVQSYTSCIRRFYEYNNIVFKGKFFTNGRAAQPKSENEKEMITPAMLRELFDVSTPMEKAMFMVQYQSGLAAEELCKLRVKDVGDVVKDGREVTVQLREEDGIVKMKLIRKKTMVKFTTFIGHDAIELLKKWIELRQSGRLLCNREVSGHAKIKSSKDFLFVGYARREHEWGSILPMTYAKYLRRRVRELGWIGDENMKAKGQLNIYRPHALRMSFSETLKHRVKVPWDIVEHMLGHKFGSTDSAYVKFNDEDLLREYRAAEPFISLTPIEPIVTDDQYKELKAENAMLRQQLAGVEKKVSDIDIGALVAGLKNDKEAQHLIVELLAQRIVAQK